MHRSIGFSHVNVNILRCVDVEVEKHFCIKRDLLLLLFYAQSANDTGRSGSSAMVGGRSGTVIDFFRLAFGSSTVSASKTPDLEISLRTRSASVARVDFFPMAFYRG